MDVAWGTFMRPDGTSHQQIMISERSDWSLFQRVADLLEAELRATWTERLDGLDQRYWDMEAAGGGLTLHLEHYLGITLYPTAGASADEQSIELLRQAYDLLVNATSS